MLTRYDEEHVITYLRLLDADAKGADWREVARFSTQFTTFLTTSEILIPFLLIHFWSCQTPAIASSIFLLVSTQTQQLAW